MLLCLLFCVGLIVPTGNLMAAAAGYAPGTILVTKVPVASVWVGNRLVVLPDPIAYPITGNPSEPSCASHGQVLPTHDTQVLLGESVRVLKDTGGKLVHVELPRQSHYNWKKEAWGLCDGYVDRSALMALAGYAPTHVVTVPVLELLPVAVEKKRGSLVAPIAICSMGSLLVGRDDGDDSVLVALPDGRTATCLSSGLLSLAAPLPSEAELRRMVVTKVRAFNAPGLEIDKPYVWGGASFHDTRLAQQPGFGPEVITGVDCSSMVMLVFNACGLLVPRNSNPQLKKAIPVRPADLQPGDFIFFKPKEYGFARANHIVIYLGDDRYIETTGVGQYVAGQPRATREVVAAERFGKPLAKMTNGERVFVGAINEAEICCGSFLVNASMREAMYHDLRRFSVPTTT